MDGCRDVFATKATKVRRDERCVLNNQSDFVISTPRLHLALKGLSRRESCEWWTRKDLCLKSVLFVPNPKELVSKLCGL